MDESTLDTLKRSDKGPIAPPPVLDGALGTVSQVVGAWHGVVSTVHWDLYDQKRIDGIDFYLGELELGHLHLDGSLHLATNPTLGAALISEGLAKPFRYAQGWVLRKRGSHRARGHDRAVGPKLRSTFADKPITQLAGTFRARHSNMMFP